MTTHPASSATDAAESETVDSLARAGLVAYGVVHILIGWLAIQLVVGGSGEQADNQGALHQVATTPLGKPLLWVIVAGFVALVLWQLAEAVAGFRDEQNERKRLTKRALAVGKAVAYGVVGTSAAKIAAGGGSSSSDSSGESFTAKLMAAPAGQVLVAVVGLAIVGAGAYLVRKGWTEKFRKQLDAGGSSGASGRAIIRLGKIGHIGKGSAYAVLGVLFVAAAIEHDAERSGGLDDALKTLLDQPAGDVLVVLIGIGIAAFGAYCFARARYLSRS